jgi:2-polyprenyl-3-methyl-5-hydroxy-6-metoxy-1,4-benzoquinol methylase
MDSSTASTPSGPVCWVCGSAHSQAYKPRSIDRRLVPDDLKISDANYGSTLALLRCTSCGFIFADSEDVGELTRLYEGLDDPGYEGSQESRALQMRWLLDAVRESCPEVRSILDVGAGAGLLVKLALERGWDAQGVEPSQSLVDAAERLYGVRLLQGTIPHPELAGRHFDAVLLVDVIEHVANPVELLELAADLVAPGGVLLVVTPDVGSAARRLLGFRWWHFRLAHVGYFDESSFERAAARAGLEIVRRFRAKWFFSAGYLAERVTRYVPVGWLGRLLGNTAVGQRAAEVVVPLNLFDSWAFVCRRLRASGPA